MISLWVFFFLAALAIISALGVVIQTNPVHSLLSLIVTLLTLALLFIQQNAVIVGLLQVIVYAGAIMVLFLFVIWLLNLQAQTDPRGHLPLKLFGSIGAAALGAELLMFLLHPHLEVKEAPMPADYGTLASLAHKLFTDYLVAFEATSILLLAAVVGAIAIARRPPAPVRVERQIEQGAAR